MKTMAGYVTSVDSRGVSVNVTMKMIILTSRRSSYGEET